MSNQYYKFISDEIVKYLKECNLNSASRFNISLEKEEEVELLYNTLKNNKIEKFSYTLESDNYESYCLEINDSKVIVAATINGITPSFCTTLRNKVKVGEKLGSYSILFINHKSLDSIDSGSGSLQREGMPLNPEVLKLKLKMKIKKSSLSNTEKKIVEFITNKKTEENYMDNSISEDFKEILCILEENKITDENLFNLGFFPDKTLNYIDQDKLNKRLEQNYNIFREVQEAHIYGDTENVLDKLFNGKGQSELNKKEWHTVDFDKVTGWMEKNKNTLELIEIKSVNDINYWPPMDEGETTVKKRIKNIIVFNNENKEEIEFDIVFNETLKKENLTFLGDCKAEINRKLINVKLTYIENKSCFSRILYKKDSVKYEFKFLVVNINDEVLQKQKTRFKIVYKKNNSYLLFTTDNDRIILNDNSGTKLVEINEDYQVIDIDSDESITLDKSNFINDNNSEFINIILKIDSTKLPIQIKDDKLSISPITGLNVWKLKRENKSNFELSDEAKLIQNTKEYSTRDEFREALLREEVIINNRAMSLSGNLEKVIVNNLNIKTSIKEAYFKIINYFEDNNLLPSTAYLNEELALLYKNFLTEYISEINSIENGSHIEEQYYLDLMKIGVWENVNKGDVILFTPLHPVNIAYQLEVNKLLNDEKIPDEVIKRLNCSNLIPYIYDDYRNLYKSIEQNHSPEWIYYNKNKSRTMEESKSFIDKLVKDKIEEFLKHFSYLFKYSSNSTLKINLINMGESKDVLAGIIEFYRSAVNSKKDINKIQDIDVTIFNQGKVKNVFEQICMYETVEDIEENLDVNLKTKYMSKADFLRLLRVKLKFFNKEFLKDDLTYSHITLYEMDNEEDDAAGEMSCISTGISMNGIVSGLPSVFLGGYYKTGFGSKFLQEEKNELIELSLRMNAVAKAINKGEAFNEDKCIVTLIKKESDDILNDIYDKSNWITFINPKIDLNFFKNNKSTKDLLIIHYSDQYTSSSGYDAITVTRKSKQYQNIIEEYLSEKGVLDYKEHSAKIINMFNAINGDWLLKMISASEKSQTGREKLSILSAVKTALAYFNKENITWIPVSMEEIYRVSGGAGLSQVEGIFSTKNLNIKGKISDDILLIGIEDTIDSVKVHYYPVEVKVGINDSGVITDAVTQSVKSKNTLISKLVYNEGDVDKGIKAIYRNFMIQIALVSAEKLRLYDVIPGYYDNILNNEKLRASLMNDNYEISNELVTSLGLGCVISFKKDSHLHNIYDKQGILILEFPESNAYNNMVRDIDDIKSDFKSFNEYILDASEYLEQKQNNINKIDMLEKDLDEEINNSKIDEIIVLETKGDDNQKVDIESLDNIEKQLSDVRILLGEDIVTGQKYYWEYGHEKLNNRHMLISGTSGSGKTYCIQALMLEMVKNNISCIVFDYTEGFTEEKLQLQFKKYLDNRLEERYIKYEQFPINPFKRKTELWKGKEIEESDFDIADRIANVFKSVYKFGDQQKSKIYNAIKSGLSKYDKHMNFEYMRKELSEMNDSTADTVLSKIESFLDINPFDSKSDFTWKDIVDKKGIVYVIQLSGYSKETQVLLTELILWDIINYCIKYGNEETPIPIILDEAQNLSHNQSSPSGFILAEGRKFGISAWYATQYLKGAVTDEEIGKLQLAEQKLYFCPPEKAVGEIGKYIDPNITKSKEWAERVKKLGKGQCVTSGSMLYNNKFSKYEPRVIKISSLEERI